MLEGDSKLEKEKDIVKEGFFLCQSLVESKMKARWGVCFFLRGVSGPVPKFVKCKLEFDGISRNSRGAFKAVEPLLDFVR